jgi:hypothetical protein
MKNTILSKQQTANSKLNFNFNFLKSKMIFIFLFLACGTFIILSADDFVNQASFEQEPPIPEHFYVQKANSTDGKNNMIVRIKYANDPGLAPHISANYTQHEMIDLNDSGEFPDLIAGDFIYSTFVQEDISVFLNQINAQQIKLQTDGGVFNFKGHTGEFINASAVPIFQEDQFNNGVETEVHLALLNVTDCDNTILKQNSLFITDLDVVEDPARTVNFHENTTITPHYSGNLHGAWTFSTLMRDMANTPVTNVTTANFLKEWVRSYTIGQSIGSFANGANPQNLTYFNSGGRLYLGGLNGNGNTNSSNGIDIFLGGWIRNARQVSDANYNTTINELNWESEWNATNQNDIVDYAPFRLMAIVNRLDLRGNASYSNSMSNAGETRFIFTFVDPITGDPPASACITGLSGGTNSAIDWAGFNIILEYGNPMTDLCDLTNFAQEWYDLSAYTFDNEVYREKLQLITDKVVKANKGGNKNVNKSAINQVRTNEKMFSNIVNCNEYVGGLTNDKWRAAAWQLRQFEVNANGLLKQVVVTNTPPDPDPAFGDFKTLNSATNIVGSNEVTPNVWLDYNTDPIIDWLYPAPYGNALSWARVNRARNGQPKLPEHLLAGEANIWGESTHYFGFLWSDMNPGFPTSQSVEYTDAPSVIAKEVRHQVSMNTCQGCHGGDTKTNFTQMIPRGYHEEANYWDAVPTYVTSADAHTGSINGTTIDNRFTSVGNNPLPNTEKNIGTTYDDIAASTVNNLNIVQKVKNTTNQIISPFITGRLYSSETANHWQDDNLNDNPPDPSGNDPLESKGEGSIGNPNHKLSDEKSAGLYYANDPSNEAVTANLPNGKGGFYPQMHNKKWGFNELQRRLNDMCAFLKSGCQKFKDDNPSAPLEKSKVLNFFINVKQIPLILHGH